MAENKDGSLIGYDPLAWMLEEADRQPSITPLMELPDATDAAVSALLIAPSDAEIAVSRVLDDLSPAQTDALVVSFENSANIMPEVNDLIAPAEIIPAQTTQPSEPEAKAAEQQAAVSAVSPQDVRMSCAESEIKLDSVLNIQNVANLHERLLKAMDNNSKILLDASAVSVADTASLQLLLILKRTAIKLQKEVVIDFPSDRFIEAADLLGISEMLEVDQAAAGLF